MAGLWGSYLPPKRKEPDERRLNPLIPLHDRRVALFGPGMWRLEWRYRPIVRKEPDERKLRTLILLHHRRVAPLGRGMRRLEWMRVPIVRQEPDETRLRALITRHNRSRAVNPVWQSWRLGRRNRPSVREKPL